MRGKRAENDSVFRAAITAAATLDCTPSANAEKARDIVPAAPAQLTVALVRR
jgi:hypothetical protein